MNRALNLHLLSAVGLPHPPRISPITPEFRQLAGSAKEQKDRPESHCRIRPLPISAANSCPR
jgi:hypothetical protein